ncbi:phorbol-12-myristate-13-acetate-induced protein 1 [Channa argus]
MARSELAAIVDLCAHELRQVGDEFYWRYKLLEILLKNYKTATEIK